MKRRGIIATLGLLCFSSSWAQESRVAPDTTARQLEELVVYSKQMLGSKFEARNRTGSAYYISPGEILKLGHVDINRMLKAVPGVNIYEEDGFGLRPNISLRGTKAERSERVTIMEDGVLAAPAPYSAPAAYYFPNAARMYAVEVLKGSSQVQYGPFTTGGAINMVSTPIPSKLSARANLSYGSYGTLKAHLNVGNSHRHIGYLVEYLRYGSNGFRDYDNVQGKGFSRHDLIAKVRIHTDRQEGVNHALELKGGYATEDSDETYVGLAAADFAVNPYRRYAGAQQDNIQTKHMQWVATYLMDISPKSKITASAYYNYFHRNWYKLNDVRAGITSGEKRSISQVLSDPETNARYYDILTGRIDYLGEGLIVRANNRTYHARGVQIKGEHKLTLGAVYLNLEGALRYHEDDEDRFQWDDSYSIVGGKMHLVTPGLHGSNANRITSAEALSAYALGKLTYNDLTITAGVRYEDVQLTKKDYTTADLRRSGKQRIEIHNRARSIIPSLGVSYKLYSDLSLFAGVHKGFAPPSAEEGQKAEQSINTECGVRYNDRIFRAEVIGFYNAYSHMLGSDLAASGGTGSLDQFNVGKARVYGLEAMLQWQPLPESWGVRMPIQLSYTYTDTEMLNDFESGAWGRVFHGDEIPYIYRHAVNAQIALEHKRFELSLGVRYNSDMRTTPGQGTIAAREKIPAHTILDASVKVHLSSRISLQANAINLLNKHYLASLHPSGLRAGHPRGIYAGMHVRL